MPPSVTLPGEQRKARAGRPPTERPGRGSEQTDSQQPMEDAKHHQASGKRKPKPRRDAAPQPGTLTQRQACKSGETAQKRTLRHGWGRRRRVRAVRPLWETVWRFLKTPAVAQQCARETWKRLSKQRLGHEHL